MSNAHHEKYVIKLPLGLVLIVTGILLITYAAFEKANNSNWFLWGIIVSSFIVPGLYFLFAAFVHKVKSDFINRQNNVPQKSNIHDRKILQKTYNKMEYSGQ